MNHRYLRELIRQSNLIEGIVGVPEIDQSEVAWWYLYDHNMPLTHGTIHKVQKIITLHQDDLRPDQRGYYRDLSHITPIIKDPDSGIVYSTPAWPLVQGMMDNWLLDYEELGPWEAHRRFERIHPFVDGNGRTGRMLMWWQELKAGGTPTMINARDRKLYFMRLRNG
jgi:Fic family protein